MVFVLEFSRTLLIVHIVKTRAGGPSARLLAGCRAAGPLFVELLLFVSLGGPKRRLWRPYIGFDTIDIRLVFRY